MDKKVIEWWAGSGYVATNSEYAAILNRASTLGYAQPTNAQKIKQDALVTALKSAGIWSLLDVFYVFANDATGNFWKLNWITPSSYEITEPAGSVTKTSNIGINGNGSSTYASTNWKPGSNGVNFTLNNASFGGYIDTEGAENLVPFGCYNSSPGDTINLIPRRTSDNRAQILLNFISTPYAPADSPGAARGFWHIKRTASNQIRAYSNGVATTAGTNVSTAVPDRKMYICARNNNDTGVDAYTAKVIGCFFAGASLDTKESAFYTAWNNYFTSL